jgi:hypothetical protein
VLVSILADIVRVVLTPLVGELATKAAEALLPVLERLLSGEDPAVVHASLLRAQVKPFDQVMDELKTEVFGPEKPTLPDHK